MRLASGGSTAVWRHGLRCLALLSGWLYMLSVVAQALPALPVDAPVLLRVVVTWCARCHLGARN